MPCWTRWGSTTTNRPIISPNAHHHHHPRRREGAVDPGPEAGDAAGCHPEGVAGTTTTTMEARPAAAVEGDVVAVGVGVAAANPPRRARMNQDELRRQMDLFAEDARQRSVGRRIAGITHTNTITTVYKDGGEPEVYRTSSRLSTPNTV